LDFREVEQMKRLFAAILIVLTATLTFAVPTGADTDTITIGYTAPFTGAAAEYGNNGWRGILLALEEINKKGISVEGRRYEIRIAKYDSTCNPDDGAENVHRMVTEDKVVAILGDHCSTVCSAIAPLCDQYKVPGITIECAVDSVTRPGHEFYFRMRPPVSMMIPLVMPKLFKTFNARTAAFLVVADGYGELFSDQMENELDWRDVKVIARETFERGAADFSDQLGRIKAADPDLVFFAGTASEGASILRQAHVLGVTPQATFIGSEEMGEMELLLRAGPEAVEGTYAISLWGKVPDEFEQRVRASFNKPMHYAIIFGYDAMHVLALAIENAQSLDPVAIRNALRQTDYQALEGRVRFKDFNGYRNQSKFTPSMIRWENGRRVHLDIFVDWAN
jgi:branched-chain amino acid transport system substrate-binding protein